MNTLYVIGCGGVGSWLIPKLKRLGHQIMLFDGDHFEEKNLDRQLFSPDLLGQNKAEALAQLYNCAATPEYFSLGWIEATPKDWLFVCADNAAARLAALQESDRSGCNVIIAANEYTDAEAYIFKPEWKNARQDPRVYYDLTSTADDPLRPTSCAEASAASPQLVLANGWAAIHADHLFWHHTTEKFTEYSPVHHKTSAHRHTTIRYNEK